MLIRTSQFGRLSALFLALGMSFAAMAAEPKPPKPPPAPKPQAAKPQQTPQQKQQQMKAQAQEEALERIRNGFLCFSWDGVIGVDNGGLYHERLEILRF